MAKLGESLIILGGIGVAGILAYQYFMGGAQATPQGGLMVTNVRVMIPFEIDEQPVDMATCYSPNYIMLDVGVHHVRADYGGGIVYEADVTIAEDSVLVLQGAGDGLWAQNIGCYPGTEECRAGFWNLCRDDASWRVSLTPC
jgi:hypothetical protein